MKTLDEKVAEKMGWTQWGMGRNSKMMKAPLWKNNEGENYGADLPDFSTDWNATKILIKFMRERGYQYFIIPDSNHYFKSVYEHYELEWRRWFATSSGKGRWLEGRLVKIKDDNLPLAACEAFMEVEL